MEEPLDYRPFIRPMKQRGKPDHPRFRIPHGRLRAGRKIKRLGASAHLPDKLNVPGGSHFEEQNQLRTNHRNCKLRHTYRNRRLLELFSNLFPIKLEQVISILIGLIAATNIAWTRKFNKMEKKIDPLKTSEMLVYPDLQSAFNAILSKKKTDQDTQNLLQFIQHHPNVYPAQQHHHRSLQGDVPKSSAARRG